MPLGTPNARELGPYRGPFARAANFEVEHWVATALAVSFCWCSEALPLLVFRLFSHRSSKANNEYRRRSKSAISAAVPKMVRHEGGVGTLRGDEEKGEGKGM